MPEAETAPDPGVSRDADALAVLVTDLNDPDAIAEHAEVRAAAAGVTADRPFGKPGPPLGSASARDVRRGFAGAVGVGLAVLLAVMVWATREVLLLVVIALFLAIGFSPVVSWLAERGLRRGLAVAAVMLSLLGVLVATAAAAVPAIGTEAHQIATRAPVYLQQVADRHDLLGSLARNVQLPQRAKAVLDHPQALAGGLASGKAVLGALAATLVVFVLCTYFLAALPSMTATAYRLVPLSRRARVGLLSDEILRRIARYLLANVFTSALAGVATAIFCVAAGVPFAGFLGLLVALFDLVPLVGALVAGVVVTLVAFTVSPGVALAAAAFMLLFRLAEDYLIAPKVMHEAVHVPPVTTVVSVLIGGALLGVAGALLAIPTAAAIQLVASEVVFPRQDER